MPKFRKKPVVIEAVQWDGQDYATIAQFVGAASQVVRNELSPTDTTLLITTLEGDMIAREGDWIIRGIKGEFYPCKPDIFAATYEAVEPE
jgi:hypothetical protein